MSKCTYLLSSLCYALLYSAVSESHKTPMDYWSSVSKPESDAVTFSCMPESDTNPEGVYWHKEEEYGNYFEERRWRTNTTERSLTIENLKFEDAGSYVCTVPSSVGKKTHTFLLIVTAAKPYFIDDLPTSTQMNATEGESVIMQCRQKGGKSVIWKKMGETGKLCSGSCSLNQHYRLRENDTLLTFDNVQLSDSGEYLCVVSSNVYVIEREFILTVHAITFPVTQAVHLEVPAVPESPSKADTIPMLYTFSCLVVIAIAVAIAYFVCTRRTFRPSQCILIRKNTEDITPVNIDLERSYTADERLALAREARYR